MKYRMLDENNDWCFGQGLSSYAKDEHAIETGVLVRLRTISGENWMDKNVGLPWLSLMSQKDLSQLDLLMIRDYILSCRGVLGVDNLTIESDEKRNLKLKYNLQTVYNFNIEGSTEIGLR